MLGGCHMQSLLPNTVTSARDLAAGHLWRN